MPAKRVKKLLSGDPLHIASIAEIPLGREMAHAINAFKTAGGFQRLGHRVTLICQPPRSGSVERALAMYGEMGLEVRLLEPEPLLNEEDVSRRFSQSGVEIARKLGCDFLYARNFHAGLYGPRAGIATVIETHAHVGDQRPLLDEVFRATRDASARLDGIVTIAPALRDEYVRRGADPASVHIVADAADPEIFERPRDTHEGLGERRAAPIALYAGHLYEYKGISTILLAASLLGGVKFELLGGTREDIERVRGQAAGLANVSVPGRVPHHQVAARLWEADVLLLPPSADHPSALWTSPVKLAEYLCARRPIAASAIQGLKNWVDAPAVAWFRPDDGDDLAACIQRLLAETSDQAHVREDAQSRLAQRFTYANRAKAILEAARASAARGS
ncbi:MAG TPA: glycosyltransferase family 4 protein [Phycisphaerales bacterium]|nr:glycosyltransferase family 4 protein [Phycisphaerales bacterium]